MQFYLVTIINLENGMKIHIEYLIKIMKKLVIKKRKNNKSILKRISSILAKDNE